MARTDRLGSISVVLDYGDINIFKAMTNKYLGRYSRLIYEEIYKMFPQLGVPSFNLSMKALSRLVWSGGETYECCMNGCMAFVGPHVGAKECEACGTSRLGSNGNPRARFTYWPPHRSLAARYAGATYGRLCDYRLDRVHDSEYYTDVWDGANFEALRRKNVRVVRDFELLEEGDTPRWDTMPFRFFAGRADVGLGLQLDGVPLNTRADSGCWPIVLTNCNLPPSCRFQTDNLIPLMIIPGKPRLLDSYLWLLVKDANNVARNGQGECCVLACEVHALTQSVPRLISRLACGSRALRQAALLSHVRCWRHAGSRHALRHEGADRAISVSPLRDRLLEVVEGQRIRPDSSKDSSRGSDSGRRARANVRSSQPAVAYSGDLPARLGRNRLVLDDARARRQDDRNRDQEAYTRILSPCAEHGSLVPFRPDACHARECG